MSLPMSASPSTPLVFGASYSVYTRIVRIALAEKGVPYRLVETDIFAPEGKRGDYADRHPFARIPAFEHDGFALYEAGAITRYIDEAFPGPALQPDEPRTRARMNQAISILDSYGFRPLVLDIYVERVSNPATGKKSDEDRIRAALPAARTCLAALEGLERDAPWIAARSLTLADCHAAPMFAYFRLAPEGASLLAEHPRLARWWSAMSARSSLRDTLFPLETAGGA